MEFSQKDFEKGAEQVKKYIDFCWKNYTYSGDGEIFERSEFVSDLLNFVQGYKSFIPNRYGKTFEQFCESLYSSI